MENEMNLSQVAEESREDEMGCELLYPTFHLRNFEHLERATGLYGEPYRAIFKTMWYLVHGEIIKETIPHLGDIETDCRMHSAFVLPSGFGKKDIENTIAKVCEGLGETVIKPTSYHPEQLVGKTICQKDKDGVYYEQIKGHLAEDVIIFDDAIDLIKGKEANYRESRKYLITALDTIGKNLITKKMVNIPREEMLSYHPHCTVILFYQPFTLSEEVVLTGLFRRFLTQFLEFSEKDRRKEFSQKVDGTASSQKEAITALIEDLKELREKNEKVKSSGESNIKMTKEARERFKALHLLLVEFGESFSPKVSNLMGMIAFGLQGWLFKMATILAKSRGKNEIGLFEVEMAFVDLLEFLNSNFKFVERKVRGALDYGDRSKGATGDDLEILMWLLDHNAVCEKTSTISINAYMEKIAKVSKVGEAAARRRYQRHVREGWIKGKQKGSHGSVVYLTFEPLLKKVGDKGDRVIKGYREIIEKNATPSPTPKPPTTFSPSAEVSPYHPESPTQPVSRPFGIDDTGLPDVEQVGESVNSSASEIPPAQDNSKSGEDGENSKITFTAKDTGEQLRA